MTKRIKTTILILLSTLLTFCVGFLCVGTVYADTTTSDNDFKWESTADYDINKFTSGKYELNFNLTLKNADYEDLTSIMTAKVSDWLGKSFPARNELHYKFTVYRQNLDGTSTALKVFYIDYEGNYTYNTAFANYYGFLKIVNSKTLNYHRENIEIDYALTGGVQLEEVYGTINAEEYATGLHSGSTFETLRFMDGGGLPFSGTDENGAPQIKINVLTESPTAKYFVDFVHSEKIATGVNNWSLSSEIKYKNTTSATLTCLKSSIKDVLTAHDTAGTLNLSGDALTDARRIIDDVQTTTATVRYLVPIGNTPFATEETVTVTVDVPGGIIEVEDLLSALNKDSLKCWDANVKTLTEENDVFVVEYYSSSWLRAVTLDGNYVDYFANFNESFEEYYYGYVEAGVFSEDLYDYLFNGMINEYTELEAFTAKPDKVYGKWGLAILPEEYSLNSFWADIFEPTKSTGEHVTQFSFKSRIPYSEYMALKTQYDYGWIDKAWSTVQGFVEGNSWSATYHIFYAEPGTSVSWIDQRGEIKDEAGAKDPNQDGLVQGGLKDIGSVFSGGWNSLKSIFKGLTGSPFALGSTIVVVVVIAGLVFYLVKGGKIKFNGTNRRKRKK